MICQICKKNPATVHVQEIIGGKKNTLHLCASCADKKAMLEPFLHGADLDAIIKDMMGMIQGDPGTVDGQDSASSGDPEQCTVCPFCSWTLEKLHKTGRLGCERCYTVFAAEIENKLPAMHRGIEHRGKNPPGMMNMDTSSTEQVDQDLAMIRELKALRNDLQGSVRREEYEIAAGLRDKIAELEQILAEKGIKV